MEREKEKKTEEYKTIASSLMEEKDTGIMVVEAPPHSNATSGYQLILIHSVVIFYTFVVNLTNASLFSFERGQYLKGHPDIYW